MSATTESQKLTITDGPAADGGEKLFRLLFDAMPQLGWTATADGFIDFYNRGWHSYAGTTHAQMEGWGWRSVHDPDVLPRVEQEWRRCLEKGEAFEMEFPLRRHDGVFRRFLTRVNPIRDADGKIVRWVGINTDVEDIRAAHAIREEVLEQGRDMEKVLLEMRAERDRAKARVAELETQLSRLVP
jgi:PAS domain S-box-containing protein